MSLKAYDDACTRAELFGLPKPDKEEFLEKNRHLDVVEFEEVEIKTAENTAMLNEQLPEASGGLTELNTILNSTQNKLNRLRGVCGSLTNFFRVKLTARDNLSYSSEPSYVGQTNYDKDYIPPATEIVSINKGLGPEDSEMTPKNKQRDMDINSALNDLEAMQTSEASSLLPKQEIQKQVSSQISQLDRLIHQADRAQTSLNHQNKQMRAFLR